MISLSLYLFSPVFPIYSNLCLTCKYCFLLLQAFIDKFRYNAKRASLVQSRIKVLIIINIRSLNQILKTYNSCDLSLHFIGQGLKQLHK